MQKVFLEDNACSLSTPSLQSVSEMNVHCQRKQCPPLHHWQALRSFHLLLKKSRIIGLWVIRAAKLVRLIIATLKFVLTRFSNAMLFSKSVCGINRSGRTCHHFCCREKLQGLGKIMWNSSTADQTPSQYRAFKRVWNRSVVKRWWKLNRSGHGVGLQVELIQGYQDIIIWWTTYLF